MGRVSVCHSSEHSMTSETLSNDPRPAHTGRDNGASPFRIALALLYLGGVSVVLLTLVAGWSIYATPLAERAHREGYWRFKPGGTVGLPLGVAGTAMMTLLLLYSVRKRVGALQRLGPLSRWLDVHIFLGIVGPLLIVLHSSFKVQGLVALSFWSMVAVAASGVLGRYLYLQIPRNRAGDEVSLAELVEQDEALTQRLRTEFGLDEGRLQRLEAVASPGRNQGLLAALGGLLVADLRLARQLRALGRDFGVPSSRFRPLLRALAQKAQLRRRIVLWDALHRLFHYWHVIHKPFAVVMYVFMIVHVAVASMTGYGWAR